MVARALETVLRRGYFPKELPPPFQTRTFATTASAGLPAPFDLVTKSTRENPAFVASCAIHNLARAGTLRRKLSIPNPVNQYHIANEIVSSWKAISKHCRRSTISLTTPKYYRASAQRAIAAAQPFSAIPSYRARTRAGWRYLILTDLNAFYPNIYTHSIPWALHTKAVAKKRKTDYALLGNRLDLAIRNGQAQQTIGIPIGPDTSLVIAEILGTAVDLTLSPELQERAIRYIDDFECGMESASASESALASLQNAFAEFELNLNPRKTRMVELPQPLEATWVPHLRLFPMGGHTQHTNLVGYFGRAFELARDQREEAILKYAIQRMTSVRVSESNWALYEDLLLGCLAAESGTTPAVVSELVRYEATHPLDKAKIRNAFERLIYCHAPQHHGSEVAWSIWYLSTSGYIISAAAASAALKIPDSVVWLCLLHARDLGRIGAGVDWSSLDSYMQTDELQGSQWLLSYEARVKGWLPSRGGGDHLAASAQFDHLHTHGVFFYDVGASLGVQPVVTSGGSLSAEIDVELDKTDDGAVDVSDHEWMPGISG